MLELKSEVCSLFLSFFSYIVKIVHNVKIILSSFRSPVSLTTPQQFLSGACVWLLLGQLRPVAGRADSGLLPQHLTYLIGLGRPPSLPPTPQGCGLL